MVLSKSRKKKADYYNAKIAKINKKIIKLNAEKKICENSILEIQTKNTQPQQSSSETHI